MGNCCSQQYTGPELHVRIAEAKGLSVVNGEEKDNNSVSPYCEATLINVSPPSDVSKSVQTEVVYNDSTPMWNFKTKLYVCPKLFCIEVISF